MALFVMTLPYSVEHRSERPVALFTLDGRPELALVCDETTSPAAYGAL